MSNSKEEKKVQKAQYIIKREESRFKDLQRSKEIIYIIIYYRRLITRSPINRAIFDTWLETNKNHSSLLNWRHDV